MHIPCRNRQSGRFRLFAPEQSLKKCTYAFHRNNHLGSLYHTPWDGARGRVHISGRQGPSIGRGWACPSRLRAYWVSRNGRSGRWFHQVLPLPYQEAYAHTHTKNLRYSRTGGFLFTLYASPWKKSVGSADSKWLTHFERLFRGVGWFFLGLDERVCPLH